MGIATLVTSAQRRRLESALKAEREVFFTGSWPELAAVTATNNISTLVINPVACGELDAAAARKFFLHHPGIPVVAYVTMDPICLRATVRLSRHDVRAVVLQDVDDSPIALRATIHAVAATSFSGYVLVFLQPQLKRMPSNIVQVVEDLFECPGEYHAVQDLARAAGVSLVRLYREFDTAGLALPRKLIVAAKLLEALRLLSDCKQTVGQAGQKVGYPQWRMFARHTREVFALTPAQLRTELTPQLTKQMIVAWLTPKRARTPA